MAGPIHSFRQGTKVLEPIGARMMLRGLTRAIAISTPPLLSELNQADPYFPSANAATTSLDGKWAT